jgi:hypothetical protein
MLTSAPTARETHGVSLEGSCHRICSCGT